MVRKASVAIFLASLLGSAVVGAAQGDYLDVLVVKVEPDKRAAFDATAKKIADASRRHQGDTWIALETVYGEQGTIILISTRRDFADIDKGYELFYGAMNKAYGTAGAAKILQDFNASTESSRGEVRRRRLDLSANVPSDPGALMKQIGGSRWVRTTMIHIRPGHVLHFEEQLRAVKEAIERSNDKRPVLVSQSAAGQKGTFFYVSWLAKSLSDFDSVPTLPQILGPEAYQKFLANSAETVEGSETIIGHFVPEISNPPEGVVSASPDFWNPKPAAPKPKAAVTGKAEAKEKQ
jgi:hypothetical protein